jgi:hypothetical protein
MKACTGRRAIVNTYKLVLKPGTPWVRVDDIPDLIAKALHPLPPGDRGDPNWVHEASEILAARKAAENGHITLLYEAIRKGDLIARNQFTNYADPAAEGDQLRNARVSIDDLKSYLSRFSIEACVFPRLPVRLSKLPPPIDPIDTSRSMDLSHRYTFTEPNWEKWKLIDSTRLWKAACLAANIEPPMDGAEDLWYERQLTHFPAAFKQIWEILNWDEIFSQVPLVNVSGRMLHTIGIADFGQWAINKGLKIPEPLREIAARFEQEIAFQSKVPQRGKAFSPEPTTPADSLVTSMADTASPRHSSAEEKGCEKDTKVTSSPNWKMRIQEQATVLWRRYRTNGANPTRNSIKEELAKWCRQPENNVKTSTGINPDAEYIARHVLRKWEPPND